MKKKHAGSAGKSAVDNATALKSWGKAGENLSSLNTMRGGIKENKGLTYIHMLSPLNINNYF